MTEYTQERQTEHIMYRKVHVQISIVHCTRSLTLWRPLLPHMRSAIKHPVSDRVKPSFVSFDIRALWRSALSVTVPGCQKLQRRLNPVWHRMLYSCNHMATVGVKGLTQFPPSIKNIRKFNIAVLKLGNLRFIEYHTCKTRPFILSIAKNISTWWVIITGTLAFYYTAFE